MHMFSSRLPPGFIFSQSSLQDYHDCPRRFDLRYIRHLHWPAVESEPTQENERRLWEGQLFHRLAQQSLIGIPAEKLTPLASTPELNTWWQNFQHYAFQFTGCTNFAEITLSAPIAKARLLAKYDLVSVHQGDAVILDWKTYTRRPGNEHMAARLQTRIYRALLVQAGAHLNARQFFQPEQVEMVYWYTNYPNEPARFPYSSAQFSRDWSALEKLVNEIDSAETFPPTSEEIHCRFCSYRSYCERGDLAGTADLLEAEMTEQEINLEQIQEIAF